MAESPSFQSTRIGLDDMDKSEYAKNGALYILGMDSILFPLEVIKTVTIAEKHGSLKYSAKIKQMIKNEGIKRFYRGMIPSVLGSFPGQATYFSSYELSQSFFKRYFPNDSVGFWSSFTSGAVADCIAGMLYVPADVTSQRLQIQNINGFTKNSKLYKNSFDVIKKIVKREGIKGLFRGYTAHIMTYCPGSAVQWGTYETSKALMTRRFDNSNQYLATATAGAIASFCSTVVTNPLDVIRIRRQLLDPESSREKVLLSYGYFQFMKQMYGERGLKVFFKGLSARLAITMPGAVVAMCGYETIKSLSEA